MLVVGGIAQDVPAAERRVRQALSSGAGLEKFREMVAFQGGDVRALEDPARMPVGPHCEMVTANRTGVVIGVDAESIGRATVLLGAGRDTAGVAVDHAVGAVVLRKPGDSVAAGDPLVRVYYRSEERLSPARRLLSEAFVIGDQAPEAAPLVLEVIR
jgi:pyrimidine-nucleoside phosphorylase